MKQRKRSVSPVLMTSVSRSGVSEVHTIYIFSPAEFSRYIDFPYIVLRKKNDEVFFRNAQ